MVYKRGKSVALYAIIAVVLMYVTVVVGNYLPLEIPKLWGMPATGWWTIILLAYAFIASTLPVTTLLQPRDYINSHQLVVAMTLMILGVLGASFAESGLNFVAPAVNANPAKAPSMWPFLFITIACGAISGFHSLVSSGTSSKQVSSEKDSLFVGYGSMLMEGALATLVIAATVAGIGLGYEGLTGSDAWTKHYASWSAAGGLTAKVAAFVVGSANMIATIGIPKDIAVIIMGVFVASFAGTTMDTATRIQRYIVTEFFSTIKVEPMTNRYAATGFAVVSAAILAFASGANGKGALTLWPLFGAVNQTLAALALFVLTVYLKSKGGLKWIVAGLPALFMAVMTLWASIENQMKFLSDGNILLTAINIVIILIVLWIIAESFIRFFSSGAKGQESDLLEDGA
jgi:carbon starvation protein